MQESENPLKDRVSLPEEKPGYVYGYGPYPLLFLRAIIGGVFMGLASVVPGVSGGTMLLAAGVYPFFIGGIADLTALRFGRRTVFVLATVLGCGLGAVILLGPYVRAITIYSRWMTFSLFLGLAVGGIPVVYGMARPISKRVVSAALAAFMVVVGLTSLSVWMERPIHEHVGAVWYFVGGVVAAGASVLPGISGAYLLLVLGLYAPLVDSLDGVRIGFAEGRLFAAIGEQLHVLVPMGVGVIVGILGVAKIFRRLLSTDEKATLGALLGLLVGALVGMWPFQRGVPPQVGAIFEGRAMTAQLIADMSPNRYPVEYYVPDGREIFLATSIFFGGFLLTALVSKFGSREASGLDLAGRSQASWPPQ